MKCAEQSAHMAVCPSLLQGLQEHAVCNKAHLWLAGCHCGQLGKLRGIKMDMSRGITSRQALDDLFTMSALVNEVDMVNRSSKACLLVMPWLMSTLIPPQ